MINLQGKSGGKPLFSQGLFNTPTQHSIIPELYWEAPGARQTVLATPCCGKWWKQAETYSFVAREGTTEKAALKSREGKYWGKEDCHQVETRGN